MADTTPRPDVPDELTALAVRANADRNHANLCACTAWPEWCTSDYSPTQWEHGDEGDTIAAVWPEIERRVREQVAAELRADADAHRQVVERKPSEHDAARLARAQTLDDAAARVAGRRSAS